MGKNDERIISDAENERFVGRMGDTAHWDYVCIFLFERKWCTGLHSEHES